MPALENFDPLPAINHWFSRRNRHPRLNEKVKNQESSLTLPVLKIEDFRPSLLWDLTTTLKDQWQRMMRLSTTFCSEWLSWLACAITVSVLKLSSQRQ